VLVRMRALRSWTHHLQRPRCSSDASPFEAAQPAPSLHRRSCGASLAAPSLLCSRRARCCCTGSGRSLAAPRAQRPDTRGAQGLPGTQVAPASRKHTAYMKVYSCRNNGAKNARVQEPKCPMRGAAAAGRAARPGLAQHPGCAGLPRSTPLALAVFHMCWARLWTFSQNTESSHPSLLPSL